MSDQARCLNVVRERVADSRFVWTLTDFGRGMTDYVRVYVVADGEIVDLTWFVATASGHRLTERGMPFGGCGYSKGLEAFALTKRTAGVEGDQSRWRELS